MIRAASAAILLGSAAMAAEAPRPFDPVVFFTGVTRGQGELKELLGKAKRTETQSHGRVEAGGWLVLDQKILVAGDPPRQRRWRLKMVTPGRYEGTLSDAKGPVEAIVTGNSVRIRYRLKGNIRVDQSLTALPSGRALANRASFSKWGMKVATLIELIEKR